jgi:hypothetical protein
VVAFLFFFFPLQYPATFLFFSGLCSHDRTLVLPMDFVLDEIWKQQATVAAQRKLFLRPSEISRLFWLSCWPLTWFTKAHIISCESRLSRDGMHVRRVAVAPLFILFLHRSFPAPIPWMVVKVIGKDGRPPRKKAAKCSVWR